MMPGWSGLLLVTALGAHGGVGIPDAITIETPRGAARLVVTRHPLAGPVLPGHALIQALGGSLRAGDPWVEVALARQSFRFLPGAPVFAFNNQLQPLSGLALVLHDSLYLPIQFVVEVLPSFLGDQYLWDAAGGRLIEGRRPVPAAATPATPARPPARLPNGLLPGHVVTVDAGHGGRDPGNPGLHLPRGLREKDITLQVALLLRDELRRQGVKVVMTRTTDTLISLLDRAPYCTVECDLFVSLHVDALSPSARQRYDVVRGFHTIVIGEENTEDADRIAALENDALRYEGRATGSAGSELDFILRNLQMNEYLRESVRAAELVQGGMARVHPGENRGVSQSNRLAVLNTARRPAILVEMGFSTNRDDARLLADRRSQKDLARSLAEAVVEYLLEYERKTGARSSTGGGR